MSDPKNIPAFPVPKDMALLIGTQNAYGISIRDYFAAKAMQGICAGRDEAGTLVEHGYEWIASESYKIADSMLKAREQ
jgi:hypothetical protein